MARKVDLERKEAESSLEIRTKWDFSSLFSDDNDPRIAAERDIIAYDTQQFINKWKDRTDYLEDPAVLQEALEDYEQWTTIHAWDGDAGYYFHLRTALDESNPDLKAKQAKLTDFAEGVINDIRFFFHGVAKNIPPERQQSFLEYPGLAKYRHYLEIQWAQAPYLLNEEVEKVLMLKSGPSFSKWVQLTSDLLSRQEASLVGANGEISSKTFEEILGLMDEPSKEIRDQAATAFNAILERFVDVGEAEMNAILKDKEVEDELRGFPRPDMERHLNDDMDTEVVDAMLASVENRFDLARRFYQLKAALLDLPYLQYHERNIGVGEIQKQYPFEEAVKIVHAALTKLDPQFGEIFDAFVTNGQIDAYPKKGKSGGGFCTCQRLSTPTYILLNHTGKFSDVEVLGHETGHGINNELMRVQSELNFSTPTCTAEVASTFMEDFVQEEALTGASDEERFIGLMQKLDRDVATIFRQVAFYRFEQQLHALHKEKGYVSKAEMGELFRTNIAAYMGEASADGSDNWWLYVSHFRSFFYVYTYASGLLISKSLQAAVRENPEFINGVKEFLSAGISDSPKNIFAKLNIDITDQNFWSKGLDEIERLLNEVIELGRNLGKIT